MSAEVKALLLTQAQALRASAAALEAQAMALPDGDASDPLLDVDQVQSEFGVGRDSLKAAADRGELTLSRGARGKLLIERSAVRAWIKSRPVQPRKAAAPVTDLDSWELEAEATLRSSGGRR